jgi:hypothetical protein
MKTGLMVGITCVPWCNSKEKKLGRLFLNQVSFIGTYVFIISRIDSVSGFVDVALLRQEAHLFLECNESEADMLPTRAAEKAPMDDSESSDEDYSPPCTDSSGSDFDGSDMDLSADEVPSGRSDAFPSSYQGLTILFRECAYFILFQADSISTEPRCVSICITR